MFSRAKKYTLISVVISSFISNTALPSNSSTDGKIGLPTNPFTDMQAVIPADHALGNCVEYLFLQKVVFGYPDKTFRSNQAATPYEILMMRRKAFPIEPQSSMSNFANKDLPSRGSVAKDLCKSLGFVFTQFNHEFSIPGDENLAMGTFIRILTAEHQSTQIPFSNSRRPVKDFVQILQTHPKDAQSYYERGVVRYYLTDYAGAQQDLTRSIQLNSNLASAYYMRGCNSSMPLTLDQRRNPLGLAENVVSKDFTKAIQLNSTLAEPYYYRMLISHLTGEKKYRETIDSDLTQAIKLEFNSNKIYGYKITRLLGNILSSYPHSEGDYVDLDSFSPGEIQEFTELVVEAIQSNPSYSRRDFLQSFSNCTDPEDSNKAIVSLTQEVGKNPKSSEAFVNRGLAYSFAGKKNEAIQDFSRAIQLEPDEPDIYYYRGLAFYQNKSFRKAIDDFRKAIALRPTDDTFYLAQCLAHFKAKDYKQAVENCDKVTQIHSQTQSVDASSSEDESSAIDANATIIKAISEKESKKINAQLLDSLRPFFYGNGPIYLACKIYPGVRCPGGGGSLQVKKGLQQNIKVSKRRKI